MILVIWIELEGLCVFEKYVILDNVLIGEVVRRLVEIVKWLDWVDLECGNVIRWLYWVF